MCIRDSVGTGSVLRQASAQPLLVCGTLASSSFTLRLKIIIFQLLYFHPASCNRMPTKNSFRYSKQTTNQLLISKERKVVNQRATKKRVVFRRRRRHRCPSKSTKYITKNVLSGNLEEKATKSTHDTVSTYVRRQYLQKLEQLHTSPK